MVLGRQVKCRLDVNINPFNPRLEQTASFATIFSKINSKISFELVLWQRPQVKFIPEVWPATP
jgi:hypothetical protein